MTTTETTQGLSADLDQVLGLKPAPEAPATDKVSQALTARSNEIKTQGPMAMRCLDMLDDQTRAAVIERAPSQFAALYEGDGLGTFGDDALDVINRLTSTMLDDLGRSANIPEMTAITRDLDRRLRGFTEEWGSNTQIAEAGGTYESMKSRFMDFVNRYRNVLHELLRDARGVQAFLDDLEADLLEHQAELRDNVENCNQLYEANEDAIKKMVIYIALMEAMHEVATEQLEAIVIDDSAADARDLRERRDALAQWIGMLEVREGEFKQRLFVAWATSPQIRNIRSISWGLAQRLGLVVNLTIPVFKLTIVQWAMAIKAEQAAEATTAVDEATEAVMLTWAKASEQMVPATAAAIQGPSMSPGTVLAIAESLCTQAEGFVIAYRDGQQKRRAMEAAMMQAAQLVAAKQDEAAAAVVDLATKAQAVEARADETLDLPELPSVITDNAVEVLSAT